MTQPWLKVYPERMLGDAKLSHLSSAEHWWLIVCLHIAANAEPYGELRLSSGRPYDAPSLARFLREPAKKVADFCAEIVASGVATKCDDGALRFPNLERLQGNPDPGATMRKRRQRDRDIDRDIDRDKTVTVTPMSRSQAGGETRDNGRDKTVTRAGAREAEGREQKNLSRNRSSKPTHGDGTDQETPPALPAQLARILDTAITRQLKPAQVELVTTAWNTSTELRHSLSDIEAAENPVAMLVSVAKRIAPPDEKTPAQRAATTAAKRAGAVQRCRYLWHQGIDDGEQPDALREHLEREYRHDPSIITEAISQPTHTSTDVDL